MPPGWYKVYGCSRITEIYPSRVKGFIHGDIYKLLNKSTGCWDEYCFIDPVYMAAVGFKSHQETPYFEKAKDEQICKVIATFHIPVKKESSWVVSTL